MNATDFSFLLSTDDAPSPKSPDNAPPHLDDSIFQINLSLAGTSVVGITLLIIFALLQIGIHRDCWRDFHKVHQHRSAVILFSLFILSLVGFYVNSIVFTYTLLQQQRHEQPPHSHNNFNWNNIYRNAYESSKWLMSLYFINKIYFSFIDSVFGIRKQYLITMAIVSAINPIQELLTSFNVFREDPYRLLIVTLISSVVDGILMTFYIQRLTKLIVQSAEVSIENHPSISSRDRPLPSLNLDALSPSNSNHSNLSTQCTTTLPVPSTNSNSVKSPDDTSILSALHSVSMSKSNRTNPSPTSSPRAGSPSNSNPPSPRHNNHLTSLSIESVELEKTGTLRSTSFNKETKLTIDVPRDLVMVTIKNMLLSFIGIVSSFAIPILRGSMMIAHGQYQKHLVDACRCVDGMINITVMYLMFAHSEPYYQCLCKLCHKSVQRCCLSMTHCAMLKKKEMETETTEIGTRGEEEL